MIWRHAVREPIRYGFAVGRVRVLESRMLSSGTYERLLDAADFAEQKRVLSDSVYGRFLEDAETTDDVERALDAALDELYAFLESANLPRPVLRFFRVRYDYPNLAGRLKAELLGVPAEELYVDLGSVPVEVITGPPAQLPPFLKSLYRTLSAEGAEVTEEDITAATDRALYADLSASAEASKSPFLAGLAALMADLANVKAILRARMKGLRQPDVARLLIEGGAVPVDDLLALYSQPIDGLTEALARLPLFAGVSAEQLADTANLDVLADDLVVRYLRRARRIATGPEPVIGYVMARQAEVIMLRTLLIGRLSGVPSDVLRRRLRQRYEE
ncbi:MAG: V-type ATP synthase subunit C [Coriobacteriia bacterium]|jgi:Archaeal/vacuolar-type H+-ATPase subunit C